MKSWSQIRCAVLGGHMPVTHTGGGEVYRKCFLCGSKLSPGWDMRDLKPPRKLRRVLAWLRRVA